MSDGTDTASRAGSSARLQQLFEGVRLTPTQRRIAHCLVRQAADVPFLSSVELAHLAGVSQPSVTRFAVALGFDGYPALRRHVREVAPAGAEAGERSNNPYQQAVQAEIDNLRQLVSLLADPGPVERAGRLLAASRPLPVLGLRAAAAQARGFAYSRPRSTPTYGCSTRAARCSPTGSTPPGRPVRAHSCASRCRATRARSSTPSAMPVTRG